MSPLLYCVRCTASNTDTALFCNRCATPIPRPRSLASQARPQPLGTLPAIEEDDLTVLYERATPMPAQLRRISSSSITTALPSTKTLQLRGQEVQHYRQKASVQSKEKQKSKGKNVSSFGLIVHQPNDVVNRHSELYIIQAGQTATRHPSSLELLSFNPREQVYSWSSWIRRRCLEFHGWKERKDENSIIDDLERTAWIGYLVKGSTGPLRVTLPENDSMIVQVLLTEIPEKQKIIFVLPIKPLDSGTSQEDSSEPDLPPLSPTIHTTQSQHRVKRMRAELLEEVASYETEASGSDDSDTRPTEKGAEEKVQRSIQSIEGIGDTIKVKEQPVGKRRTLTEDEQKRKREAQNSVL